jgi:glucose/arabinose dehydrogenase
MPYRMTLNFRTVLASFSIVFVSISFYGCYYKARGASYPIDKNENIVKDTIGELSFKIVSSAVKEPVDLQVRDDQPERFYVSDLKGKIFILLHGHLLAEPFLDIRTMINAKEKTAPKNPNENILFGMAFHPDFTRNHKFYICYKAPNDQDGLNLMVVSEFRTSANNPDKADPSSERVVLQIHDKTLNDGTIAFGSEGYLYLNFADMDTLGGRLRSQNLNSLVGKVLRIDINKVPYGIPASNPYATDPNKKPEIWASGFRKLWRFSFDPKSQQMIGADVGDKKLEEVDIIKKAGNYGWPYVEGDSVHPGNYRSLVATFVPPVCTYPRTVGICTIGGYLYEGKELPALRDKYIFGDMNGTLFALNQSETGKWTRQIIKVKNKPGDPILIYSFARDTKGELYVIARLNAKDGLKGEIYKLVKAS